jgi:pimeloyl-ACP methyl ester carboxylesterase
LGLVRLLGPMLAEEPTLPTNVAAELVLLQTQPQSLRATAQEGLARSVDDAALTGALLGDIPLVVIAAGDSMVGIPGWAKAQAALADLSVQGRLVVAEDSSHLVQVDRPEIVAVLSVLDAIRTDE